MQGGELGGEFGWAVGGEVGGGGGDQEEEEEGY